MKNFMNKLKSISNGLGVWTILIAIVVILSLTTNTFLSSSNIVNVIRQICVTAIVAQGATFVMLGGELDLSTGALAALIGTITTMLIMQAGLNTGIAILIALALGTLCGLVAGVVVTYVKVPAFIATLGMQYIYMGTVLLLTNSQPIINLPESFTYLGRGYIGFLPVPVVIMFVTIAIGAFVLKYTSFGRNVLAVGENPTVARLSGLNVEKIRILIFAISGFASSLGGIILMARLSSGQPTSGADLSLQAIAAVYVGGTSQGSVVNTLAGALIVGLINNGLNILKISSYWQQVALGIIIVVAVAIDNKRSQKALLKEED